MTDKEKELESVQMLGLKLPTDPRWVNLAEKTLEIATGGIVHRLQSPVHHVSLGAGESDDAGPRVALRRRLEQHSSPSARIPFCGLERRRRAPAATQAVRMDRGGKISRVRGGFPHKRAPVGGRPGS